MRLMDFALFLIKRFEANDNRKTAAALTFVSLFAVVPLMTFGYSLLTYFPEYSAFIEQFQSFLFQHFVPTSGEVLQEHLHGFAHQAKQLTTLGLAVLLISAVGMMMTLEAGFNQIWRIGSIRMGRSLILYWLVLVVGPLLLGAGFLISSYLFSSTLWLTYMGGMQQISHGIVKSLPFLLSTLAFSLTYYFLPRCQVRFRHAFMGGLIATALLELAKQLFVFLVSLTPSYQIVYGAFALVPLLLLWIYIAWCVLLLGAEFVRALPFAHKELKGIKASELDWALMILKLFYRNQNKTEKKLPREVLILELGLVDADEWEKVLWSLIQAQWFSSDFEFLTLNVDLQEKTVGELSEVIHERRLEKFALQLADSSWIVKLKPILQDLKAQKKAALGLPISDVLNDSMPFS